MVEIATITKLTWHKLMLQFLGKLHGLLGVCRKIDMVGPNVEILSTRRQPDGYLWMGKGVERMILMKFMSQINANKYMKPFLE